ncbi:MAG: glycosyltransferase [Pyrinomonadaceae bacterium]|nr:glycosyltransferase [Pyrinomonadaceae bacterium]
MDYKSLILAASFSPQHLQSPISWVGHLPFAAWIIKEIKPRIFVELGTHSGNSYFSFCQEVKEGNLQTKCFGIDTWKGDEHSGYYGEEIFTQVKKTNQELYQDFSSLLRMTFDEAIKYFEDESIDLLHIDGLHTYAAVKNDFESWLPKLSPKATVIFHDTNVREKGFGVWKLWMEIKVKFPANLEFFHSHGLGVIQLNKDKSPKFLDWLVADEVEKQLIKKYFNTLGSYQIQRYQLEESKNTIFARDEQIQNLNRIISEKDTHISNLSQFILEKDGHINNFSQTISEKDKHINSFSQLLQEKDLTINNLNLSISKVNSQNEILSNLVENQKLEIEKSNQNLQDTVDKHNQQISSLNNEIAQLNEILNNEYEKVQQALQSNSWKITAPLRKTKKSFTKVLGAKRTARICDLVESAILTYKSSGVTILLWRFLLFTLGKRRNNLINSNNQTNLTESPKLIVENTKLQQLPLPISAYQQWIQENESSALVNTDLFYQPLISVITPVFNTEPSMLKAMIDSVRNQTYQNWELCLADGASTLPHVKEILDDFVQRDNRIKVRFLPKNLGISGNSNEACSIAKGDFIALLDHDDELSPNALLENVILLNNQPSANMIYSDEDKIDLEGNRCDPHFKPDWSPDLFNSMMYTCHLGVYKKSIFDQVGGFRSEFDGAQDYDLVLRFIEKTSQIFHIPKILYHWRMSPGSTSFNLNEKNYAKQAQLKAVTEHFKRLKIEAEVFPGLADNLIGVKRKIKSQPSVSIIIPTCDKFELLEKCIGSIKEKTRYSNYEIVVVDNNSVETKTFEYFQLITQEPNISVIKYPFPFNFSAINNFAANSVKSEILLFLNNDTEVINPDWLEAMVEHAVRREVGAVGARLLYPDDTLQHGGVIVGIGSVAGHSHKYFPKEHPGYFSRAKAIQNLSAVTGACLMVRNEVFQSLGGFNEENLAVAFNDVDFCLRIREKGFLIVYTPYAELYHYESVSRGSDEAPEKVLRFNNEVNYMKNFWRDTILNDPYYNPNLTLLREDFSINV